MAIFKGTSKAETLNGSELADTIKAGAGDDILNGLGDNDVLDGGAGADAMTGGAGNDVYIVDNIGDTTIESLGGGIDTVKARISFTLAANIEKLSLTGSAAINGTGNDLANAITGNAAANVLTGLGGNDTLNGGLGADTMNGGVGNDTYIVDNAGDTIIEAVGQGVDTVKSGISQILAANVDKLLLTGSAAVNGTGNGIANTLTGNDAANILDGAGGADTLLGGGGADRLIGGGGMDTVTGGAGADMFVFTLDGIASRSSSGADTIVDFTAGDKIDISAIDAQVQASGYGQPGDQSFVFIGQNRLHNHTGGELRYEITGGNTYVYGEFNGDTNADFCIKLTGVHTLSAADFVF